MYKVPDFKVNFETSYKVKHSSLVRNNFRCKDKSMEMTYFDGKTEKKTS